MPGSGGGTGQHVLDTASLSLLQALSLPAATRCQMAQPGPELPLELWRRGQRMDPALPLPAAPSTSGWSSATLWRAWP
ncbi:hypothetical protein EK904_002298 [Melospiza melodia maxima]|nr:hypothetical protein EK904_002298 [Melospiza melodia maxima]